MCVCVNIYKERERERDIINSHWYHGVPWILLSIRLYHPSLLGGPLNSIQCQCRTDAYKFLSSWQTMVRPCIGAHEKISLMRSSLHLKQCLLRFSWIVCEMGGKLPYSSFFLRSCCLYVFKTVPSIFVYFPSSFFLQAFR